MFGDDSDDLTGQTERLVVLVNHDEAARLGHRAHDRLPIERNQAPEVDHLDTDAFRFQLLSDIEAVVHRERKGHDRDIRALASDPRLPDRHHILLLGHRTDRALVLGHPAQTHDSLVEHEDDRVVALDGGGHEALRVVRIRRNHDLHAWQMRKRAPQALRMLRTVGVPTAGRRHEHHGHTHVTARLVVDLGHVVVDLVHADAEEVGEHELDDGSHALHGRADAKADEGGLREGRVQHTLGAEAVDEPGGGGEDAAVRTDVFAYHKDGL